MKKVPLLESLRDLATERACTLCSPEKSYFPQLVDVFEEKLLDEYVQQILDDENERRVRPFLQIFCDASAKIPFPFIVDGKPIDQIRKSPKYSFSFEVSKDGEEWLYLRDNDSIRLFQALDAAGLLSFDDE